MLNLFRPSYRFDKTGSIPYGFFADNGISCVLLDIDNTLVPDNYPYSTEDSDSFLKSLREQGISYAFVSNNKKERVDTFTEHMDNPVYSYRSAKPLTFKLVRTMKKIGGTKENTLFIGDQLFTDMLCGNCAGIRTLLVTPINTARETRFFKLKRYFENKIFERMEDKSDA